MKQLLALTAVSGICSLASRDSEAIASELSVPLEGAGMDRTPSFGKGTGDPSSFDPELGSFPALCVALVRRKGFSARSGREWLEMLPLRRRNIPAMLVAEYCECNVVGPPPQGSTSKPATDAQFTHAAPQSRDQGATPRTKRVIAKDVDPRRCETRPLSMTHAGGRHVDDAPALEVPHMLLSDMTVGSHCFQGTGSAVHEIFT
jgi:hypothetical protein